MRLALVVLAFASCAVTAQVTNMPAQRMTQGQPQPQPTGNGAISGNVVNEVTKEPIKRTRVSLRGTVDLNAVTDDAGHFAFLALPAGAYVLQVQNERLGPQRPRLDSMMRSRVILAGDEQKSGVVLNLMPPATISGHLTDEEGQPLSNCNVTAMQPDFNQGVRTLGMRGGGNTDGKGEYRIANLAPGKYFVLARCRQTIPLPHAFIRRNSGVEVPTLSYAPQYYPGTPDVQAAAKVAVTGGAVTSGIDLSLSPGGGVTVRGKVASAEPGAASGNVQIMLEPRNPMERGAGTSGARIDRQTGEFRFEHVMPGSYNLIAGSFGESQGYAATVAIEVTAVAPDPIGVMLTPSMTLKGILAREGDADAGAETPRITLMPVERFFGGPPPNSPVQKDGTFSLNGVLPGLWSLRLEGAAGYVKSVTLDNRESESTLLDIPAGATGPVKIVVSTSWAQLEGTVSGLPSEPGQNFAILWRVQDGPAFGATGQPLVIDAQGKFSNPTVQPGKYLLCAVGADPFSLMQHREAMEAMQGRCEKVELSAGNRSTVDIRFIQAKDLQTILATLDN